MNVKGAFSHNISTSEVRLNGLNNNRQGMKSTNNHSTDEGTGEQADRLSMKNVDSQIESLNELLEINRTQIRFNKHEELDRMYVQIVSQETDEVVKEIPPEKFLDMIASMLRHAGLLIDKRV